MGNPLLTVSVVLVVAIILLNVSIIHTAFAQAQKTLKLGYFPNINHAQGVIGIGDGSFQKTLGNNITLETFVFNAGPSAIESLLAGRLDASYIGPNPAINGYVISDGQAVRVISGATSAGASFVVRNDSGINSVQDIGGKKFASPQLGNTQDVALRKYLTDNGFNTVENGGNVTVLPIANADILTTFLKKEIDGAWGARALDYTTIEFPCKSAFIARFSTRSPNKSLNSCRNAFTHSGLSPANTSAVFK
jgi:NitT/TauT family transport system substrate-binding protein